MVESSLRVHKTYAIHPSIGIARVGNSRRKDPSGWFVGPEVADPDFRPAPDGKYRDPDGAIRRQAARFRVYETTRERESGRPLAVRELTGAEAQITWQVHLVNRKPFVGEDLSRPIDPGEHSVSGAESSAEVLGEAFGDQVLLATLLTDADQRLLALGGFGVSRSPEGLPIRGLQNPGWYDDHCDGPVRATVVLRDGSRPEVESAWLVVSLPSYATPVVGVVTLYDLALDRSGPPWPEGRRVCFARDIYPILSRPVLMKWVSRRAARGHSRGRRNFLDPKQLGFLRDPNPDPESPAFRTRDRVLRSLKNPEDGSGGDMPAMIGLRLTARQHAMMQEWRRGNFDPTWPPPSPIPFDELPVAARPGALDEASLWSMSGGGFRPGIETSRIMQARSTYSSLLRINPELGPGALTEGLAIPWQSDYASCGRGWWPSARPNAMSSDGESFHDWIPASLDAKELVHAWTELGFLVRRGEGDDAPMVEVERGNPAPSEQRPAQKI